VIVIGDTSHAILPTHGQGASQSIEDAVSVFKKWPFSPSILTYIQEALGAFFSDVTGNPTYSEVKATLKVVRKR
jgi:2-polyprenyl-6-methoxyphenol hydroxylase-like FAD-dependent oxidoreductase